MTQLLNTAPLEFTARNLHAPLVIRLPTPDGGFERFSVVESPIIDPHLAARIPHMRTYAARGLDDPTACGRFDLNKFGFHAMILSSRGDWYVRPLTRSDNAMHVAYWSAACRGDRSSPWICEEPPEDHPSSGVLPSTPLTLRGDNIVTLRIFRLAVTTLGEFWTPPETTCTPPDTNLDALVTVITIVNWIDAIYRRDLAATFAVVDSEALMFRDAATDPFVNGPPPDTTFIDELLNDRVGILNYDVGHGLYAPNNGGLSWRRAACLPLTKGKGRSSRDTLECDPLADPFWLRVFAHELGHQLSAEHTFNSVCGSSRVSGNAFELGKGVTIMSYANGCGDTPDYDDLQPAAIAPYFHAASLAQITSYITPGDVGICATDVDTDNIRPSPVFAGPDRHIPAATPFELQASAVDANGDFLTYCWEQMDLGPAADLGAGDLGSGPLFRSYPPSDDPARSFPRLDRVISGSMSNAEVLPTTARTMRFRVTVRDNRADAGGAGSDDIVLTVVPTGASFRVTSHSVPSDWEYGTVQMVTWDIAGTTTNGIDCAEVNIDYSADGGATWPWRLASFTPNDGSQSVLMFGDPSTEGRIRVSGANHVFFNVNAAPIRTAIAGACCAGTSGTCTIGFRIQCSGAWLGPNTTCDPNPCRGACCSGQNCSLASSALVCGASGGNWQGFNTACLPSNPCLTNGGACCFIDGTCAIFTSALVCVEALHGDWKGLGSVCSPANPCDPAGACCDGVNCALLIAAACPAPRSWRGPGTACIPNLCQGACCADDGSCFLTPSAACPAANWHVGILCSPNPCPAVGACCDLFTGDCALITQSACFSQAGSWRGPSTPCSPESCPPPTGACCNASTCTFATQAACTGAWQGAFRSCDPNPCAGACCTGGSMMLCQLVSQAACTGIWLGEGTTCAPNQCAGACCSPTGACTLLSRLGACSTAPGWTFLGWGTVCQTATCFGPCCTSAGGCTLVTPAQCTVAGGVLLSLGTSCAPTNPCPGACCTGISCTIVAGLSGCALPGAWQGPGTTCTPSPCLGACCAANGSCSLVNRSSCSSGDWLGSGVACGPACFGACCTAAGSCITSLTRPACEGAGHRWIGSASTCGPNACWGACCRDGFCSLTSASSNCLSIGVWQGAGTACSPSPCVGACCRPGGLCTLAADGNQCAAAAGTWLHLGSACIPNPCPQPDGACCIGAACTIGQASACAGAFKGPGTACGPNRCCRADFNYSQNLGVQDIFDFLATFFAGDTRADFNRSNTISVQDIFDFLAAYFAGCP
jgi:hypothetical protein